MWLSQVLFCWGAINALKPQPTKKQGGLQSLLAYISPPFLVLSLVTSVYHAVTSLGGLFHRSTLSGQRKAEGGEGLLGLARARVLHSFFQPSEVDLAASYSGRAKDTPFPLSRVQVVSESSKGALHASVDMVGQASLFLNLRPCCFLPHLIWSFMFSSEEGAFAHLVPLRLLFCFFKLVLLSFLLGSTKVD